MKKLFTIIQIFLICLSMSSCKEIFDMLENIDENLRVQEIENDIQGSWTSNYEGKTFTFSYNGVAYYKTRSDETRYEASYTISNNGYITVRILSSGTTYTFSYYENENELNRIEDKRIIASYKKS